MPTEKLVVLDLEGYLYRISTFSSNEFEVLAENTSIVSCSMVEKTAF